MANFCSFLSWNSIKVEKWKLAIQFLYDIFDVEYCLCFYRFTVSAITPPTTKVKNIFIVYSDMIQKIEYILFPSILHLFE